MILAIGLHERLRPRLKKAADELGVEVWLSVDDPKLNSGNIQVLLYWSTDVGLYERCLEILPALRWIHVPWTGVEWLFKGGVADGRIMLSNSRGTAGIPVAEYAIGAILAASKDLSLYRDLQLEKRWSRKDSREVNGARLLIVGFGSIGKLVARYAIALGMKVDAVTRTPKSVSRGTEVHGPEKIMIMLAKADYIVSALPATPQTRSFFNEERFGAMQPHACFINVGRGDVVDEAALEAALRQRKIAAAYLDVFRREPLPRDSTLWNVPGLSITPHAASWTDGKFDRSFQIFLKNLKAFRARSDLVNIVDFRSGY